MPSCALQCGRQLTQQPSQCLWITDDILGEAFNRFARVSNATRHQAGNRRYGSNIPGPLEARRRWAKRRMGIAASVTAHLEPSIIDFGALFGLGKLGPAQIKIEEKWKWQPPGATTQIAKVKERTDGAPGRSGKKSKASWENCLHVPEHDMLREQNDVAESKTKFERMLLKISVSQSIQPNQIQEMLAFLRSTENERKAHNTSRLVALLSSRSLVEAELQLLLDLVLDKIRLETIDSEEINAVLVSMVTVDAFNQHTPKLTTILDALPPGFLQAAAVDVTRRSLQNRVTDDTGSSELSIATQNWLFVLGTCKESRASLPKHSHPIWRAVYDVLSALVPLPIMVAHLATLPPIEFTRLILQHWLPRQLAASKRHLRRPEEHTTCTDAKLFEKSQPSYNITTSQPPTMEELMGSFDELRLNSWRSKSRNQRRKSDSPVRALFMVLQRLDNDFTDDLMHDVFSILIAKGPRTNVVKEMYRIKAHTAIDVSKRLAKRLVDYLLEEDDIQGALNMFRMCPALPLRDCERLALRIASAPTHRVQSVLIWDVLLRQTKDEVVPMEEREAPRMNLTMQHIMLVHRVAEEFAKNPHISTQIAQRRVWECYRFLKDRSAPITGALTKAFVKSAVTRRLLDRDNISPLRLRYVLALVARYESTEVAAGLDEAIFQILGQEPGNKTALKSRPQNPAAYVEPGPHGDEVGVQTKQPWFRKVAWSQPRVDFRYKRVKRTARPEEKTHGSSAELDSRNRKAQQGGAVQIASKNLQRGDPSTRGRRKESPALVSAKRVRPLDDDDLAFMESHISVAKH